MAHITLTGTLLTPAGKTAYRDQIRFTHKSTTGETVRSSVDLLTIIASGFYYVELEYGLVLIEYKSANDSQFKNLGVATVNGTNPSTSIPELLNGLVPVSSAELIQFQAILADAVTAKNESVVARNEAEAFAASIDLINDLSQAYIFDTVAEYKASTIVFPLGKTVHLNDRGADFAVAAGTDNNNNMDIIASTSINQKLNYVINYYISPNHLGANSYVGLRASEASSTGAINRAYQLHVTSGAKLSFGSLKSKFFMDGEILLNSNKFDLSGGVFEYLASYTGAAIRVKVIDATLRLDNDSVWDKFKVQTTLEDDITATRSQKEGNYIGIVHDTSSRSVFNVRFNDYFLQRPLIALQWTNKDGSGNDFSTTVLHNRGSYLAYKTCVQVLSGAGIVGEQQFNSPIFLEQRTTPSTLFDIQKGTSFMVNEAFYWNDGDQSSTLFNITADARMSMVVIRGGYWESEASEFINSQVSIDGNFKLTTKPGGGVASQAIIFQPNATGLQTNNLVTVEPINWVVTSGTIVDNGDVYQARPMFSLNGIIRFDIGWEERFKDLQNFTFSCWVEPDTSETAGLAIQVNYTDETTDDFSSAFVISNGKPQLIGVDLSPTGLSAGKVPSRILVTVTSGTGTALVGIPVINLGATMPLYSVPLLENLTKERYRTLTINSQTPSLRSTYSYFVKTENTSPTVITDFTNGNIGQEIFMLIKDSNTSVDFTGSSNIRGNNPTGGITVYALNNSDALRCIKEPDGQWYCSVMRSSG